MKANKMSKPNMPEQQPNIEHGNSVFSAMKPVVVKKAANMKLCKGEDFNRGKI